MKTLEKPISKAQEKRDEQQYALDKLRDWCKPGTVVYTTITHTSQSGMSRSIELFIVQNNEITKITYFAARAMGDTIDQKNGGIKVSGCGMDMGFHIVMNLSYCLHGTKAQVPDHPGGRQNITAMNNPTPELFHAGYSLIQRWL